MDLPEFLLARYAEREAVLRKLLESRATDELPELARGPVFFIEAHDDGLLGQPTAVRELFADLEAKRAAVERYAAARDGWDEDYGEGIAAGLREAVELLAQPFAAHPAFRPEWRT